MKIHRYNALGLHAGHKQSTETRPRTREPLHVQIIRVIVEPARRWSRARQRQITLHVTTSSSSLFMFLLMKHLEIDVSEGNDKFCIEAAYRIEPGRLDRIRRIHECSTHSVQRQPFLPDLVVVPKAWEIRKSYGRVGSRPTAHE
jgi:hypothetical protein